MEKQQTREKHSLSLQLSLVFSSLSLHSLGLSSCCDFGCLTWVMHVFTKHKTATNNQPPSESLALSLSSCAWSFRFSCPALGFFFTFSAHQAVSSSPPCFVHFPSILFALLNFYFQFNFESSSLQPLFAFAVASLIHCRHSYAMWAHLKIYSEDGGSDAARRLVHLCQ